MIKVLVVGQAPPPYHGQALAIQRLVSGSYESIQVVHAPMRFSHQVAEIGRFQLRKLFELVRVIAYIVYCRVRYRPDVLYYPPAGPNKVPVYRDLIILNCTRWLFRKTAFHFHACGVSGIEPRLSWLGRRLFDRAYKGADAAIRSSDLIPNDGKQLDAHRDFIVPLGVDDETESSGANEHPDNKVPVILFAGIISENKGILVLLEACGRLARQSQPFRLEVLGAFESAAFERQVRELCHRLHITSQVCFRGVRTGREKRDTFARSDLLCFPSHHPTETFGLVLIEALSFGLPVVATRWRAAPSIVQNEKTGLLIDTKDPIALAEALGRLLRSPTLRKEMAKNARARYVDRFTTSAYLTNMEHVFLEVACK